MTLPDLDFSKLSSHAIRRLPNDQLGLVLQETLRLFETDRRENQIFFYKPTSEPVLELFSTDRKVIALGGGNGSGKTENALVYIIALATGMIPDSVAGDMKPKFKGPLKCRVVVESLTTTLHPIILPKLKWWVWTGAGQQGGDQGHWGWIPKMCLIDGSWEKSWSEKLRMLRLVCRNPDNTDEVMGESSIQFMSHDQDPSDFASGDFNIVLHDEPPSQAIWRENEARTMRVDGTMMLSMTWPDDPTIPVDWIYDEVYDRRDENVCWIELHTTQNPHLNQEAIARQMASWSEEMRQVRIFGQPIRFSNRIHSLFTDTTAFWSLSQGKTVAADTVDDDIVAFNHVQGFDNPPNWPCIWLLDPHPRKPHMFMWVQVDPSDDLWVIAEGKCDGDPAAVARHVEGVEYDMGLLVRARLIDPNMGRSPASTKRGVTWQDEFDAARLYCDLADDNLGVGIRRINDYLVPDSRTRRPRLHIHSRCRDTIFQIKRYVWEDYRRKDERDLKNKPRDKNDDFPTLLRYCLNYEPRFSQLHDGAVIMQRPGRRKGAY